MKKLIVGIAVAVAAVLVEGVSSVSSHEAILFMPAKWPNGANIVLAPGAVRNPGPDNSTTYALPPSAARVALVPYALGAWQAAGSGLNFYNDTTLTMYDVVCRTPRPVLQDGAIDGDGTEILDSSGKIVKWNTYGHTVSCANGAAMTA